MVRVWILGVARVTDVVTGDPAIQVVFGESVPSTPAMRERFSAAEQQPPVGTEALHQIATFLLPPSEVEPYQIGSQWDLEHSVSGEITIRRTK